MFIVLSREPVAMNSLDDERGGAFFNPARIERAEYAATGANARHSITCV